MTSPSPLDTILAEIQEALDAKLYYVALATALTLPDICSLLERDPSKEISKQHKYAEWFNNWVGRHYSTFNGDDCYRVRCGVQHWGHLNHHPKRDFDRVMFLLPGSPFRFGEALTGGNGGSDETALSMDLLMFCTNVMDGVRTWYEAKHSLPLVQSNMANLISLRPQGVPPHIVGVPIIA